MPPSTKRIGILTRYATRPLVLEMIAILAVLMAIVYIYYPVVDFDYVWDDHILIVNDARMQSGVLTWEAISRPVLQGTSYFRPLVFLTYIYEVKFFGPNSGAAHFFNILIFLLNAIFAYLLARKVLGRFQYEKMAWLVFFAYGIHPVLVESNAWISGRFDLLATTFTFLSLLIFLKRKRSTLLSDLAISASIFFGLLSKEMAIVAPGLILLYWLSLFQTANLLTELRRFLFEQKRLIILIISAVAIYFFLRHTSMGEVYHLRHAIEVNRDSSLFLPIYTIAFYLHQIILPFFEINPQHDITLELAKTYQNPFTYLIVAVLILGLTMLAWKGKPIGWLGLAAFFSLLPVLNIIPMTTGGNIGHERFLATPLVFFLIFFAYTGAKIYDTLPDRPAKRMISTLVLSAFFFGCFFTSKSILPIWRSDYTLWGWMYKKTPEIELISTRYFLALINERKDEELDVELSKILSKGSLSPLQMAIRSSHLLNRMDPAATKAIEQAIAAIKNQDDQKSGAVIVSLDVSTHMLYALYFDKAHALALLDGDINSALEASIEADRWRLGSINYKGLWRRLAYYYLLKNTAEVDNLYKQIKDVRYLGGEDLRHSFLEAVYQNCLKFDAKDIAKCEVTAQNALLELGER